MDIMQHNAALSKRVKDWFNNPEQIRYYSSEALLGLSLSEDFLVTSFISPHTRRVLDFGCGAGRVSIALGRRGLSVWGVDIATELLTEARILVNNSGQDITVCDIDGEHLPFATATFDVIICFKAYCYTQTRDARLSLLRELRRVLVPGGRLLMTQQVVPDEYFEDHKDEHFFKLSRNYDALEPGDTFPAGQGYVHWFTTSALHEELNHSDQFSIEFFENDESYGGDGLLQLVVLKAPPSACANDSK